MLKVLSKNKIASLLAECKTPDAIRVLSYTMNGKFVPTTPEFVYNVFSNINCFKALGGAEQAKYAALPDGNVMLCLISTHPDGQEQSRRYFIVRFTDTNFLIS